MIPFPAFRQAIHDHRIRKRDLLVFDAMLDILDWQEFRPCKRLLLAHRTGMRTEHVTRSLRRLHRMGYLEADTSSPRQYRLLLSRRMPNVAPSRAA